MSAGVHTPVRITRIPGGMSVREVLEHLHSITATIVGADIVEFNPSRDPVGLTAPLCAKLVKELVAAMMKRTSALDA